MDQEVAKTLGELELKLQELERELTSIGRRETVAVSLDAPGKLVDEVVERDRQTTPGEILRETPGPGDILRETPGPGDILRETPTPGDILREENPGPADFPREETTRLGETAEQGGPSMAQEVQRDWRIEVRETAFGEIPSHVAQVGVPDRAEQQERQSIDLADLVQFRDKLARTMDELIDEYSRLLSLKAPVPPRGPDA